MPLIHWFEDDEATGELAKIYAEWKQANPGRDRLPGILKCFSPRPDFLRAVIQFSHSLHFSDGFLRRRQKEMIATLVSGLNQCPY